MPHRFLAEARAEALAAPQGADYAEYWQRRLASIDALDPDDEWVPTARASFGTAAHEKIARTIAAIRGGLSCLNGDQTERAASLFGCFTVGDDFAAQLISETDGSAAVVVSESVLGVCKVYCDHLGAAFGRIFADGAVRGMLRVIRAHYSGVLGADPLVLAGLLRFHHVNRRVHGVGVVLDRTSEHGSSLQEYLFEYCVCFITAHEAAHHLLRHENDRGTTRISVPAVDCSLSELQELEADALALRISREISQREFEELLPLEWMPQRMKSEMTEFFALVGATIAMTALYAAETALLVRRGNSHLPADVRANLLIDQVLGRERLEAHERARGRKDWLWRDRIRTDTNTLHMLLDDLVRATVQSADFGAGDSDFDWDRFARADDLHRPAGRHLERVRSWSRLMQAPREVLTQMIYDEVADAAAVDPAHCGSVPTAILAWGVTEATAGLVDDTGSALAFYTLVERLQQAGDRAFGPMCCSMDVTVAAATLVARRIQGAPEEPGGRRGGEEAVRSAGC